MLDQALTDVRDFSHKINQDELIDNLDLRLQFLASAINETSTLDLRSNILVTHNPIPKIQTQLYRIAQEALNNVLKDAQATEAQINFSSDKNGLTLEIVDNGIGFDTDQKRSGMGIVNLKEGATEIDADIQIKSELGVGSKILLTLIY
ncbi:MAG: signal transduction histidine kinase [Saprospiraceae bacterium]|jgi:signal transduction histidine kinase